MKYKIIILPRAIYDLENIYNYIAINLEATIYARNQTNRILNSITSLEQFPEKFPKYNKGRWKHKNLRKMPVDNFIVFYDVDKIIKTVYIIRIFYGKQDIDKELEP